MNRTGLPALLHPGHNPKLDRPLQLALAPNCDRDLMAAFDQINDRSTERGRTILRETGARLGELLDLELDCLLNFASHGEGSPFRWQARHRRPTPR